MEEVNNSINLYKKNDNEWFTCKVCAYEFEGLYTSFQGHSR